VLITTMGKLIEQSFNSAGPGRVNPWLTDTSGLDVAKILLEAHADRGESHCYRRTQPEASRGPPSWKTPNQANIETIAALWCNNWSARK